MAQTLAAFNPRQSLAELRRLRIQGQVFSEETACWICQRYADPALDGTPHPWSRTVDHLQPAWLGGNPHDRSNSRLAHTACRDTRHAGLRAGR
ncbi:hypothetical protein [Streptomyces sp. NPDC055058]